MFYLGESPFKLIGFLVRHFRNLILVKNYRQMGYGEGQIKEKTKLHPFVIKNTTINIIITNNSNFLIFNLFFLFLLFICAILSPIFSIAY